MGCSTSGIASRNSLAAKYRKLCSESEFEFLGEWTEEHETELANQFNIYSIGNSAPFIAIIKSYLADGDYKAYVHTSISPLGHNYERIPDLDVTRWHKIAIWGAGGVGKSALTIRLTQGTFLEEYDPTIEDAYRDSIALNVDEDEFDTFGTWKEWNKYSRSLQEAKMDIYDPAGIEDFYDFQKSMIRESDINFLVFSVIDRSSFEMVKDLLGLVIRINDGASIVVVCNKWDLVVDGIYEKYPNNAVDLHKVYEWIREHSIPYIETSAKTGKNVCLLFRQSIYEHHRILAINK